MRDVTGLQLGSYTLIRLLAHGGQASVYLGQHTQLDVQAAVKVLNTHLAQSESAWFRQEAQTLFKLNHPHIIRMLDFGIQEGMAFLIMEYAPNGTLRQRHPAGIPLPAGAIAAYTRQMASALQFAHDQKLVHRDVKPENMLIGQHNQLLLSDFGIAIMTQSSRHQTAIDMAGTIPYMAPEQIESHPQPASDQYSLAVVVYEWLCGERPFTGSAMEIASKHYLAPPPPLRSKLPTIAPEVEEVVLTALAKDPNQRFVTVQAFSDALEQALLGSSRAHPLYFTPDTSPPSKPLSQSVSPVETPLPSSVNTDDVPATRISRNRQRLLTKVYAFWINGVLKQSLQGAKLVTSGLRELQSSTTTQWNMKQLDQVTRSLPFGTRAIELFHRSQDGLVILGEAGSGKTMLLLDLTRDLLKGARNDETSPVPVVFHLSSWASHRQPLAQWMVEELERNYQVPRKLGESWIDTDQVLPLLDGLDEVAPVHRLACVDAINLFRRDHALVPLVVSCRLNEYYALLRRIQVKSAIIIQPLTPIQINEYLLQAGSEAANLRAALRSNPLLLELAKTPLMLTILMLAYQGAEVEHFAGGSTSLSIQEHVFATYIRRMLTDRGTNSAYSPNQVISWLSWLAFQLQQHQQTEFYIERMQTDWLPQHPRRFSSFWLRMVIGLVAGVSIGLISALSTSLISPLITTCINGLLNAPISTVNHPLTVALTVGVVSAGIGTFIFALTQRIEPEIRPADIIFWSWKKILRELFRLPVLSSLLVGLLIAGMTWLFITWEITSQSDALTNFLGLNKITATPVALLCGLEGMLAFAMLHSLVSTGLSSSIARFTFLQRAFLAVVSGIAIAVLNTCLLGLGIGLYGTLANQRVVGAIYGLYAGLSTGAISGCVSALALLILLTINGQRHDDTQFYTWRSFWQQAWQQEVLRAMALLGVLYAVILGQNMALIGEQVLCLSGYCGDQTTLWLLRLSCGAIFGTAGVCMAAAAFHFSNSLIASLPLSSSRRLLTVLIYTIVFALFSSLTMGAGFALYSQLGLQWLQLALPAHDLFYGLSIGAISGGCVGLLLGLLHRPQTAGQPKSSTFMDTVWSRLVQSVAPRNTLIFGLTFGIVFGLACAMVASDAVSLLPIDVLADIHTAGPVFGVLFGFLFGLVGIFVGSLMMRVISGLSSEMVEAQTRVTPNQGIRRSVRNSLFVASIGGLLGLLLSAAIGVGTFLLFTNANIDDPSSVVFVGAGFGLVGGVVSMLISSLPTGAIASLQHLFLRIRLWRVHCIPWQYARFLDYAAERVLLHKFGGGYIFIHRALLEYFAERYNEQ